MLTVFKIIILGIIQGAAELLPVSSSAHVVVAEKLMGVDPASPGAMFLLVMLHTGTMLAVIAYFWSAWRRRYFSSMSRFIEVAAKAILATAITGVLGLALIELIQHEFLHGEDVETLARHMPVLAVSLLSAGVIILYSGAQRSPRPAAPETDVTTGSAAAMGFIQALCLPFRGFSRSGATISAGMLAGTGRRYAEEFSFALALLITPPAIAREYHRLSKTFPGAVHGGTVAHVLAPGLLGLVCSFIAGLVALRWLSNWLENGRWSYFGIYCLLAAAVVGGLAVAGF